MKRILTYIFYGLVGLLAIFLLYQIYLVQTARASLHEVDPAFIAQTGSGNVTIVKFLSYACVFCRNAHPVLMDAVRQDGNVTVIMRPISLLSGEGYDVTKLALAAADQGKFFEVHEEFMMNYRPVDEQTVREIAQRFDMDTQRLLDDWRSDRYEDLLLDNARNFVYLGGEATPTFFVNKDIAFTPGDQMLSVEGFMNIFEEARSKKL